MGKYFVYIIESEKGRHYIGQTRDLYDRLTRHNSNRSKATKNKGIWNLVISFAVPTRSEAILLEQKLKKMKNPGRAIKYLQSLVQSIPADKSGGS